MKKLLLTGAALVGFSCGVFAQGWFVLDSSSANYGLAVNTAGNYYSGTYGLELYESNGAGAAQITAINAASSGAAAYALLSGWSLEATIANQTAANGIISVGSAKMADVSPKGATVAVALAVWNNNAGSWGAAGGVGGAATRAGVYAWMQGTGDYTSSPPGTSTPFAGLGDKDLVMTPIPEPSTFALAGLGAAALLIFRRRK